jgi:hypothetical protein
VRRSRKLEFLIVAALAVLVAVAAADSLRSHGSSSDFAPDPDAGETSLATPRLTPKQRVRDIGDRWARHFADGVGACEDMTQPLCERIACVRVGSRKIKNCRQPSRAYRKSFDGALVLDIAFKGNQAAARFSNGRVIELWGDEGSWLITKIGGDAGRGFCVSREVARGNRFCSFSDNRE